MCMQYLQQELEAINKRITDINLKILAIGKHGSSASSNKDWFDLKSEKDVLLNRKAILEFNLHIQSHTNHYGSY